MTPRFIRRIASQTSFGDGTLSPELENAAAARLGALALVVAIAATVVVVVAHLAKAPSALDPRLRLVIGALDVALSLALYFAITRGGVKGHQALSLGFAYAVAHGILSSVLFHSMSLVAGIAVRGWTPVAVWALVYPLVVPTPRKQVWIATLATAATDPLGLWVNVAAGAPLPATGDLAQMFLPTVLVCILAPVAAGIVYNLTVEVKKAREMGSYRLVEKLGQGGMGEVWRAEHRMLTRGAAVKLIRPIALGTDEARAREIVTRFEREAQATAALRSPHTVAVYDYGVADDGAFHYVMELLEGFTLQQLVERFGPVPPGRAVRLLRQACHSLAEAHATGLIHRDLKPANMFVCRLGLDVDFVKVLDFGLVKVQASHAGGLEGLTVEGAFMGTPGFIPPEVALGNEGIDGRADLYALGCVAYYLVTGRRVFENDNAMKVVVAHIQTPPIPPSQRTTQPIQAGLEAIIMRCLEKEPENRPASAAVLSSELLALGLEDSWTEENAREWWEKHNPADARTDATVGVDEPGADATVSQTRRRMANRQSS